MRLVVGSDYVVLGPPDRLAQVANTAFDAATFEIWGALLNGGAVVMVPKDVALDPSRLAATLRREGVTAMFLTTALFNQMVRDDAASLASLEHVLFGGEAVDPASVRAMLAGGPPRRLLHVYGPTESTTFTTWHGVTDVAPEEGE